MEDLPALLSEFKELTANYTEFDGWDQDISGAKSWSDLPVEVQRYVSGVAELTETKISFLSVGPGRDQIVWIEEQRIFDRFIKPAKSA